MASPGDPELKGGFSMWMRNKPSAARELEPFAASPPAHDDSFFYIRYPKAESLLPKTKIDQDLSSLITQERIQPAPAATKDKDWSKHTKPCQNFINGLAPVVTNGNPEAIKPKPAGVDDGFKGEGAACGSSIVKVAHKMVSQRGFAVATPDVADVADGDVGDVTDFGGYDVTRRRGSRSAPTSPNSRRRTNGNRYFTSPFEPVGEGASRSWLAAALLGYKKELREPTHEENTAVESRLHGTLAASVESLGPAPRSVSLEPTQVAASQPTLTKPAASQEPTLTKPAASFRPKPSEMRELNFWSPTSM